MKKLIILILLAIFFARESNANQTDNLYKKLDLIGSLLTSVCLFFIDITNIRSDYYYITASLSK